MEEKKKAEELAWTSSMGEEGPNRGPTSAVTLPKLLALLAARKEERRVRLRSMAAPQPVSKENHRMITGARDEEAFALWQALRSAAEKDVAELVFYNIVPRWVGVQLLAGNEHEFASSSRQELVDAAKRLLDLEEETCGVDDWGSLLGLGEKMSEVLKTCMRQVESREKQEVARFGETMREIREGKHVELECYGPMRDVLWALNCNVDELPGADGGYAERFEWEGEGMCRADWVTKLRVEWAVVKMPGLDVWEEWQSFVAAKGGSHGCLEGDDREALLRWRRDGGKEPEWMAEWRGLTADWAKWRKGAGCSAGPCNMGVKDVPAEEVEVDEQSLTTRRKKESCDDSGGGGGGGASVPNETHVHDLPDECLLDILSRIHTSNHLPSNLREHFWVGHPLQCAVVCKRWHALADAAVVKMRLPCVHRPDNIALAQSAIDRFTNVTSLTLSGKFGAPSLLLADRTPQLQHLALDLTHEWRDKVRVKAIAQALPRWTSLLPRWTSLRVLDLGTLLSYCNIKSVKAILNAVASMPSLQHLNFSYFGGKWTEVCTRLAEVTGLETVHLECSEVPPVIGSGFLHKVLRKLILHDDESYGDMEHELLLDNLGLFTGLEVLHVKGREYCGFVELPGGFSNLRELMIDNCESPMQLPDTLEQLSGLQILQVAQLETWPDDFEILQSLQALTMIECVDIPDSLTLLTRLECLDVTNCGDLPFSLTCFPRLREVHVHTYHSSALCLTSLGMLTKLTALDIQDCYLKALPDSLRHLASLETCTLADLPYLQFLPDGISEWRRLTMLDVSLCPSLQTLPAGLGELTALRLLSVKGCNSFESLPRSMGSLHCLEVLRVIRCKKLMELPASVGDLRALRVIKVDDSLELPESLRQQRNLHFDWPEQL